MMTMMMMMMIMMMMMMMMTMMMVLIDDDGGDDDDDDDDGGGGGHVNGGDTDSSFKFTTFDCGYPIESEPEFHVKTGVSLLKLGAAKVDGNQCSGRKLSFEEEPKEEVKKVTFAPGTKGGDMTPFTMNSCDRKSDPPLSAESVEELNKAISEAQKQNKAERKEDRKTVKTAAKAKCEGNKTKKQKEDGKEDEGKKASAGKDKGKNQKAGKSKKELRMMKMRWILRNLIQAMYFHHRLHLTRRQEVLFSAVGVLMNQQINTLTIHLVSCRDTTISSLER